MRRFDPLRLSSPPSLVPSPSLAVAVTVAQQAPEPLAAGCPIYPLPAIDRGLRERPAASARRRPGARSRRR